MKKFKAFAGFLTAAYAYSTIPFFAYFIYDLILSDLSISIFSPLWLLAIIKALFWPWFIV